MAAPSSRQYDLVLLGATGYTGKLCAEHIALKLPANLKWAVGGRSSAKLSAITEELRSLNPDRLQPGVEVAALTPDVLDVLAKKTRLLLNTVGPYHLYSSPVVEACAQNGTHYLDVTGETPWVLEMIKKHHDTAKENKAIIIPEIGLESAPSDLLVWSMAKLVREKLSVGIKEAIASVHEMKALPSGGTIATLFSIGEHYSRKELSESMKPWALSPIPGPTPEKPVSLYSKIFGIRVVPDLGILSSSLPAKSNEAIVQRSWGLFDSGKFYGSKFSFHEYQRAGSKLSGFASHLALTFGLFLVTLSPFRWLIKKFVYAPGQGPSKAFDQEESVEYRAVAIADENVPEPHRAFSRFRWEGGIYYLTGVLLAEAAIVILRDDTLAKELGGGVLTPAMLGQPFIDRLKDVGVIIETELISQSINERF